MFTSGGQAARSKYCRRQGSASQIGIEVQFDWNIVFIVQTRQGAERRAPGAPCHEARQCREDAWTRQTLPTLRNGRQRSSNVSAWMEKFAPASVHVAARGRPGLRAQGANRLG